VTTTTSPPATSRAQQFAELTLPGISIGLGSGAIAGGVALLGGLSVSFAATTALTLGIPLAVFGMGYDILLARGKVRLGVAAPAAVYWLLLFPLARLLHEVSFDIFSGNAISLPDAVLPFLVFQAMLSVGYAIGFVWLHEHVFPNWWIRIREHNPVADRYVEQYMAQAATMQPHAKRRKP
jgi:hypothetical protein